MSTGNRTESGGRAQRDAVATWPPLALMVGGITAYVLVLAATRWTRNLDFVPLLLLLGALVGPLTVLLSAVKSLSGAASWRVLIAVMIGNAVLSTVTAGMVEHLLGPHAISSLLIALVEETAKLFAPLAAMWCCDTRRAPRAGVLIGIAAGLGFGVVETMGYGLSALTSGGVTAVDHVLLLRGLLSPARHVAWTGVIVAVLWRVPGARSKFSAWSLAVAVFAAGVGLHALWDDSASPLAIHVAVALISMCMLWAASSRSRCSHVNLALSRLN